MSNISQQRIAEMRAKKSLDNKWVADINSLKSGDFKKCKSPIVFYKKINGTKEYKFDFDEVVYNESSMQFKFTLYYAEQYYYSSFGLDTSEEIKEDDEREVKKEITIYDVQIERLDCSDEIEESYMNLINS